MSYVDAHHHASSNSGQLEDIVETKLNGAPGLTARAPHVNGSSSSGTFSSGAHAQDNVKSNSAKLFIGQIPPACNEDDLRPLFEPFGKLMEVVIFRNRANPDKRTSMI